LHTPVQPPASKAIAVIRYVMGPLPADLERAGGANAEIQE
jgi:hypothetical protein